MKMTHETRSKAADILFEKFTTAIAGGASHHGHALLFAMQAVGEAKEQMQCILANAQLRAITYSGSAMLAYIAQRREAQSTELQVFLTEISNRITAASSSVKAAHGGATAAWIDFINGWLSNEDLDLVDPASLEAANAAIFASPSPTPTYQPHPPPNAGTPGKGKSTIPGGSGVGGGSIAGGSGGTSAGPLSPLIVGFRYRGTIHCSAEIIGTTLGVAGSPTCSRCRKGTHFNGECPQVWGKAGFPLPGFDVSGARIASCWHSPSNEPTKKTIRAWVDFIKEDKNYTKFPPSTAGVPGAPDLASFEARVATAPVKP
jgi:hypothetical protein